MDTQQRLAADNVVGDRSTDSDRGSSLSECTPPTALDLARRLYSGDDDASSDYWSAKASADHLPSTPHVISTAGNVHQTDGNFNYFRQKLVSYLIVLPTAGCVLLKHQHQQGTNETVE